MENSWSTATSLQIIYKSRMASLIWKQDWCLAQGMPGHNTGINTIVFIKKNLVQQNRAKGMTY
jgi:hypothetical protein